MKIEAHERLVVMHAAPNGNVTKVRPLTLETALVPRARSEAAALKAALGGQPIDPRLIAVSKGSLAAQATALLLSDEQDRAKLNLSDRLNEPATAIHSDVEVNSWLRRGELPEEAEGIGPELLREPLAQRFWIAGRLVVASLFYATDPDACRTLPGVDSKFNMQHGGSLSLLPGYGEAFIISVG